MKIPQTTIQRMDKGISNDRILGVDQVKGDGVNTDRVGGKCLSQSRRNNFTPFKLVYVEDVRIGQKSGQTRSGLPPVMGLRGGFGIEQEQQSDHGGMEKKNYVARKGAGKCHC